MCDNRCHVGSVVVHVMSVRHLIGSPMSPSVDPDDPITPAQKEEHLRIPIVRRERPAVMKHDWLSVLRSPVLEKNLDAVVRLHIVHGLTPSSCGGCTLS